MFQNVADSELSAGEAASFITSQIKAFKFEAQDYEHILDAINEVSNNFAVSSTDISTALSKTSAAMSVLGNSFEETIGLVTAGTEILTGQASKVARGLRTIGNNIANTANNTGELTYQVSNTTKSIQLIDEATGDLKSTFEVLGTIAQDWDKMSTAEQQAVGIALAGKNQFEVFAAVVDNFGQAINASNTAIDSQGSAAKENAKYMESLEAAVARLKSEWQALSNSLLSSGFIKFFINAGTALLKFANSDLGQTIIKTTALAVATKAAIKVWGSAKSVIFQVGVQFVKLIATEGSLTAATQVLTTAMLSNPLFMGVAAGLLIFSIVKIVDALTVSFEELSTKIDENTSQIEAYADEIEELSSHADTLTETEKARLKLLQDETAELQNQNAELREQQKQLLLTEESTGGKVTKRGTRFGAGADVEHESKYDYAKSQLEQAKSLKDLSDETKEYIKNVVDYAEAEEKAGGVIDDNLQIIIDLYNALNGVDDKLKDVTDDTSISADAFSKLAQSEGSSVDTNRQILASLQQENEEMIKKWHAMQDLVVAEAQLRKGQKLSETQIQALIAKYPALINNIDAMRKGELSAANAIHAVGVQSLGTSKTVIANSKKEADAVVANSKAEIKSIIATLHALEAKKLASGDTRREIEQSASYQNILRSLVETQQALRDAEAASTMYAQAEYYGTTVTEGSTAATNKNTKATEEQNKAVSELTDSLKKQADALKEAADLMISKIDIEIDALEKQKDAIQDTNDALEDQIELEEALDALARAKSKKVLVYQNGQFQYSSDAAAVGEAQKNLNDLQRKQAIQNQLDAIDRQIDALKEEQETWKQVSNAYDEYLGAQALGVKAEGNAWQERIGQAKQYANEYLKIMKTIASVEAGKTSVSAGQKVVTEAQGFAKTLPKSTSKLLDPMQYTSSPTWSTGLLLSGVSSVSSANNGVTVIQQFGDISLPNVTNVNQFIEELSNYKQYAVQVATQR